MVRGKFLVAVLAIALLTASVWAQNIEEGQWIKLFDGESLYGWTNFGDANWAVVEGNIVSTEGRSGFLATTSRFANFELQAKVKIAGDRASLGLAVRASLELHQAESGAAALALSEQDGKDWMNINIKAIGDKVTATVNDKEVKGLSASAAKGHILLQFHRRHDGDAPRIQVAEMKLRPIGMNSLMNGKDLSGWNIFPGLASVFSVVDGGINIKSGNGQIETEGVYRDFILQMDIISNGPRLNSGVFYRGPKGVFWKGYESQVRNYWEGDYRSKPLDYGTGGLYGVRPARKVVSTDGEWFNKTVVCDGNHMAIWINGIQVSDFYDTRPINADHNALAGYVPIAGTIHLQGHDPTTDLTFKNINLQEYK
jgi:hypothetical protein